VDEGSFLGASVSEESRLQEKLGHHGDSGEVSPAQPPVLFRCPARLACVFVVCACECVSSSTEVAPWAVKGKLQVQESER